jgi:hypothetical protein
MNWKTKLIIFIVIIAILAWLATLLAARPTSAAARGCDDAQADWNKNTPNFIFSCMSNPDPAFNTIISSSKAYCPVNKTCARVADCDGIPAPDKKFPYTCVLDSDPAKSSMVCDKFFHCPGGVENTCCHGLGNTAQVVTSPALPSTNTSGTTAPTLVLSSCCGSIVPSNTDSIDGLIQVAVNIYNCILCLVGAITLLFVVIGGVVLILSGGSSERISTGRKIIVGAIIGLIVVLASVVIVNFAIKALGGTMTIT